MTTGKPAWHFQTVHNDRLGLRSRLAGDAGRFPDRSRQRSRAGAAEQAAATSTCSTARPASRWSGVEERAVPQGGVEAGAARQDPAILGLSHARATRSDRARHVGHVADRPDDLPDPVQARELSGHVHAADRQAALHRISRLQRRLGLGRRRRRSGTRRDHRQLQRHAELQPAGAARGGRPAGLDSAPIRRAAGSAASRARAIRRPARPMPSTSTPDGGCRSPACCASSRPMAASARSTCEPARRCGTSRSAKRRTNGPFGIPSMLPHHHRHAQQWRAVVTAGGLIFIAAATDNLIRAIDIKTRKDGLAGQAARRRPGHADDL